MRRTGKSLMRGAALILLLAASVFCGCRSMPSEKPPAPGKVALPPEQHEIQPPEEAVSMPHELEGFEHCIRCHYDGGPDGDATIVDKQHYCSACHEMARPFHFDHGDPPDASCPLCHRPE